MSKLQNGKKRFVFFYFNRHEPEKIRPVVPAHVDYWKNPDVEGYIGGPFSDRSGGLISFLASSYEEADRIIMSDPFILEDLIAEKWVKEWVTAQ